MSKKYICTQTCQARTDEGFINFYAAGDSDWFKECPPHFVSADVINKDTVDFMVVSPSLLKDDTIPLEDIVAFHLKKFGEDLTGESRLSVVNRLVKKRATTSTLIAGLGQVTNAHEFKNDKVEHDGSGIHVELKSEATTPVVEEPIVTDEDLDALLGD